MLIRAGFNIAFEAATASPMLALLGIHPSRRRGLRTPHPIETSRGIPTYDVVGSLGSGGVNRRRILSVTALLERMHDPANHPTVVHTRLFCSSLAVSPPHRRRSVIA